MKKNSYLCVTVLVGIVGYHLTITAGLYCSKDNDYLAAYLFSNLGVILPVVALEIVKLIQYKGEERRVYSFDILGVVISAFAVFIFTSMLLSDFGELNRAWIEEFVIMYWPWVVSLLLQSLLLACKSKKTDKK